MSRLLAAIDAVAAAREQAVAAVETELWVAEYPEATADAASLRLSLMRLSRAMPDVRTQTAAINVIQWLRDDGDWLNRAVGGDEEASEHDPTKRAIWEQSKEGQAALARQQKRIIESVREQTTRQPGWEEDK